jgi:mRNA interferase RelE/StbE
MASAYQIHYSEKAAADIQALRAYDSRKILEAVERHLRYDAKAESRSRIKRMKAPFWSQYRLRVDEFRVYYDVADDAGVVNVLRVLLKATTSTSEEPP